MEIQMKGFKRLKDHPETLFRIRAREYKKLALEIYPLLKTAIRKAPSQKVKIYLIELKQEAEDEFKIPLNTKITGFAVPLLEKFTGYKDALIRHPQPPAEVNRYGYN